MALIVTKHHLPFISIIVNLVFESVYSKQECRNNLNSKWKKLSSLFLFFSLGGMNPICWLSPDYWLDSLVKESSSPVWTPLSGIFNYKSRDCNTFWFPKGGTYHSIKEAWYYSQNGAVPETTRWTVSFSVLCFQKNSFIKEKVTS